MKTALKKTILWTFISLTILVILGIAFIFICYFTSERVKFSPSKLQEVTSKIEFFDNENTPIKEENSFNSKFVKITSLPNHVKEAFISIEDKEFYNHKGLNYKRMLGALIWDLKNGKFEQGASTISQQLIKNTHLSSQKTLSRKMNEIVLAKQLEKNFSKDEILEKYLNIIYFGDNCYGIESASNHYFSKSAKNLNLQESALLAGIISSPGRYCPITKPENAKKRRNLVLKEMFEDNKISNEEYQKAKQSEIEIKIKSDKNNRLNCYSEMALDEAISILKMPAKQISNGGYKIYTFLDKEKQAALENAQKQTNFNENNNALISINATSGEVQAFCGESNYKILKNKRQPGSAIKPILVYAPAINEGIINPLTQILDEEINISGYAPKNHDNKFHGYISVKDAICSSYNIPAVKIMSYTTIDKSKKYAEKCGIEFAQNDDNYSIALGGMTYGTDLCSLTSAYSIFTNNGKYIKPKFVKYITDSKDRIIYVSDKKETSVIRDDTAYLMNHMLVEASQKGTSKRLKELDFEIASKTGTVGKNSKNYDAWSVSYTTEDIVGVWVGNMDNSPIGNIVGGNIPIEATKTYFKQIYSKNKPQPFKTPSSIEQLEIDAKELSENHQIVKAGSYLPERYRIVAPFSRFYPPKNKEHGLLKLKPATLSGKIIGNDAILTFDAQDYLEYEIWSENKLIAKFENKSGKIEFKYYIPYTNKKQSFTLITKMKNYTTNETFQESSKPITLIKTKDSNIEKINEKWYL